GHPLRRDRRDGRRAAAGRPLLRARRAHAHDPARRPYGQSALHQHAALRRSGETAGGAYLTHAELTALHAGQQRLDLLAADALVFGMRVPRAVRCLIREIKARREAAVPYAKTEVGAV